MSKAILKIFLMSILCIVSVCSCEKSDSANGLSLDTKEISPKDNSTGKYGFHTVYAWRKCYMETPDGSPIGGPNDDVSADICFKALGAEPTYGFHTVFAWRKCYMQTPDGLPIGGPDDDVSADVCFKALGAEPTYGFHTVFAWKKCYMQTPDGLPIGGPDDNKDVSRCSESK